MSARTYRNQPVAGSTGTFTGDVTVGDDLTVTDDASVGDAITCVSIAATNGTFTGDVVADLSLTCNGNTVCGNAAGDTFKVHGTGGSGAQEAFVAQLGAFTDPPSAAEMAALRSAVNNILDCLINHGLMAAS